MTRQEINDFARWLVSLSDREIVNLWIEYCAPTENENAKNNPDKAELIANEFNIRGL